MAALVLVHTVLVQIGLDLIIDLMARMSEVTGEADTAHGCSQPLPVATSKNPIILFIKDNISNPNKIGYELKVVICLL